MYNVIKFITAVLTEISKQVRFDGNNYVRVNIIILILLLEWKYPKIKK